MGEVRVKVKLTNVADLHSVGSGTLDPQKVRTVTADALVDTGAVRSCIPQPILDRLGLKAAAHMMVENAKGKKEAAGLAYGVMFDILDRQTSDDALELGDEVLIGQTLLEKMDLLVDPTRHRLIPNPAHPDVAVNKLK